MPPEVAPSDSDIPIGSDDLPELTQALNHGFFTRFRRINMFPFSIGRIKKKLKGDGCEPVAQ